MDQRFKRARVLTTAMVIVAGIMEAFDEKLLPALYKHVGKEFNASMEALGTVSMVRAFVQALAAPIGGILGHVHGRISIITGGLLLWGLVSVLFGCSPSLLIAGALWALNGVGLSMVLPNNQSLIADYYMPQVRGRAFGWCAFAVAAFGMFTVFAVVNAAPYMGWRAIFIIFGVTSGVVGLLVYSIAVDPRRHPDLAVHVDGMASAGTGLLPQKVQHSPGELAESVWTVIKVPTFIIIVIQGIVGSTPWVAMNWLLFYFQVMGLQDRQASIILTCLFASAGIGSVVGGLAGDFAAKIAPNGGRVAVAQFSVFAGIPLTYILFKGLPVNAEVANDDVAIWKYMVVMACMGMTITWTPVACNQPIMAEVVPSDKRDLVYAFDRCFEQAIPALFAPLVGLIARFFGYTGTASLSSDPVTSIQNTKALGSALLLCMAGPWALCVVSYTALYYTYPRDRVRSGWDGKSDGEVERRELLGAGDSEGDEEVGVGGSSIHVTPNQSRGTIYRGQKGGGGG